MKTKPSTADSSGGAQVLPPEPPRTFEDACIDLLCKQENNLSALSAHHAQGQQLESLDTARKMIVAFLDFAEAHFTYEQLSDIGRRLHDIYQQTKQQEKRLLGRSYRKVRTLVGLKSPSDEEIHGAHEQLRKNYARLFSEFFAVCVARFSEESLSKEQFLQGVETFVSELDGKW